MIPPTSISGNTQVPLGLHARKAAEMSAYRSIIEAIAELYADPKINTSF
jgi:hypothetical protein